MAGTIITKKGMILIAKLLASNQELVFTRAAVGTGSAPHGWDPAGMIGLNQYKMDGKISSCHSENEEATVVFQISSTDVESGFVITEAGIFAEDPDEGEILYAYLDLSDDPQYVYAKNSVVQKFAEIEFKTVVGAIENITVITSPDALVTKEVFEKEIDALNNPEFEDYSAEGAEAPDARTAIEEIKSKKSIFGIMSNIKAALKGLVTLGEMKELLVNNGLCNIPGQYFLDAAFGKNLQDQVTDVNNNLNGYKIYTSISQLGLSTYSSIVQLVNALPSNSVLTFTITNSEWEQSLYPMLWGEVFIQKYSTRARIIFTSQQISSDDNYAYIKYTNYNDETNWAKIILDTTINPNEIWKFDNTNAITIPNGADMKNSNYLELGVYKCDTSAGAATLKNCPTKDAFTLFVYKTLANHAKYITQEFRTIDNQIFKRYYNGYDEYKGWKNDVEIVTSPGLGINTGVQLNSGFGVYAQVGNSNDYTRFVVNNKWVVIEHFTNGVKDKSVPLWDGK